MVGEEDGPMLGGGNRKHLLGLESQVRSQSLYLEAIGVPTHSDKVRVKWWLWER